MKTVWMKWLNILCNVSPSIGFTFTAKINRYTSALALQEIAKGGAGPGRKGVVVEQRHIEEAEEQLEAEIAEVKRKLGITVKPHTPPKRKAKRAPTPEPINIKDYMAQPAIKAADPVDTQRLERMIREKRDLEALVALGAL
jgi:hypothetical protein